MAPKKLDLQLISPDELIEVLGQSDQEGKSAYDDLLKSIDNNGHKIFTQLIWTITSLRFDAEEAKAIWDKIIDHKSQMSEKLERNVGIRVAAIDYLSNIVGKLSRPRVIHLEIYDSLNEVSTTDLLTNLANRRYYRQRFDEELRRARRYRDPLTFCIFDIDNFKAYNDEKGYSDGDRVLKVISEIIKGSIRDSDFAARWGGEEFVVLMPQTAKKEAKAVSERVRVSIQAETSIGDLTISGGVSTFPTDGSTRDELFSFADRALYRAKGEGKNRICMYPYERRNFPRFDEEYPVKLTPETSDRYEVKGTTENIGAGGIAFRYPYAVPVATIVKGEVDLKGETIVFRGRVVRIEEGKDRAFELGIEFAEIDEEAFHKLMNVASY